MMPISPFKLAQIVYRLLLFAGLAVGCQYSQVLPERGFFVAAQINGTDWLVEVNSEKSWKGFNENIFYARTRLMRFRALGVDPNNRAVIPQFNFQSNNIPLDSLQLPYTFSDKTGSNTMPTFFMRWRDTNIRPYNDSRCAEGDCSYAAQTGDNAVLTITKRTETMLEGEFSGIFYLFSIGFGGRFSDPSNTVVVRKGRFRMPYERN